MVFFIPTTLAAIVLSQPVKYSLSSEEKRLLKFIISFDVLTLLSGIPIFNLIPLALGVLVFLQKKTWERLRRKDRVLVDVMFAFLIVDLVLLSLVFVLHAILLFTVGTGIITSPWTWKDLTEPQMLATNSPVFSLLRLKDAVSIPSTSGVKKGKKATKVKKGSRRR